MLKNYIKGSNIIELVSEDTNEDSSMYKAVLRVIGKSEEWSSIIVDLLMSPDDDSDYVVSVRKEYYISEENKPTFCWVLVIWGDLFESFAELGPILQRESQAPVVKQAAPRKEVPKPPNKKIYRTEDGVREVGRVKLPFKRGRRDDPGTTKTLGSRKGVGAYVSNVTSNGGL